MPAVTITVPVSSGMTQRTPDDRAVGRITGLGVEHDWGRIDPDRSRGVEHRRSTHGIRRRGVIHGRLARHHGWRQKRETKGKADGPTGMCRSGQHGANPNQT